MVRKESPNWKPLLFFCGLALTLRFFSFFPSVINHDESTYIVISDTILKGYTYFIDFVDTKPVGIFLVYAFLQKLVGSSVFMLRLSAALVLGLTAFFLYRTKFRLGSDHRAALAAGVLYLVLNSIFTFYGLSPNTETFFNLFTALALWILFLPGGTTRFFWGGLCLGFGFLIKYVVLFDALAISGFFLWEAWRKRATWTQVLAGLSALGVGMLLPFLIVLGYYQTLGNLSEFLFYTFTVSSRYPEGSSLAGYLQFSLDFFVRFLPVSLFALLALRHRGMDNRTRVLGIAWALAVLAVVLLPGKFFGHYFIHFMLPFSFLAGEFFSIPASQLPPWLAWVLERKRAFPLLIVLFLANSLFHKMDYYDKQDDPKAIAAYLESRLEEGDRVFLLNDQITYHLIGQLPLIPYVHPSLVMEEKHIRALDIDTGTVWEQARKQSPRFLVLRREYELSWVQDRFGKRYQVVGQVHGKLQVWEKDATRPKNQPIIPQLHEKDQ